MNTTSWLKYIYQRVTTILELTSRTQRRLDAIECQQAHTAKRVEQIATDQGKILELLQQLVDGENPEPATSVGLTAGAVEEQP